tara:strand:+ start:49 stop:588 length:540 start_codon:yes stop_codon:yes gene_type:complete
MIIKEHKVVFIHIPKSAGTSIESFFGNSSFVIQPGKHDNVHDIKRRFPNAYKNYRKFAIIRNPYDKMVSWYFYLKRNLGEELNTVSFNEWLIDPLKLWHVDDPISFLDLQCTWIDETVEIIKYENLKKEINDFFGKNINLPVLNKSNHEHYSRYYDKKSSDFVYEKYKEDFKKFNYKKI